MAAREQGRRELGEIVGGIPLQEEERPVPADRPLATLAAEPRLKEAKVRISRRAWERPRVVRDRRPAVGESREDVLPAPRPKRSVFEEFEGVVDADGRPLERALDSDKAIRATKGRLRGVIGLDRCECPKPPAATGDFAAVPAGLDEIVAPFEQDRGGPELVDGKGPRVKRLRVAERFDPRRPARHPGALRFLGRPKTEPEFGIVEKGARAPMSVRREPHARWAPVKTGPRIPSRPAASSRSASPRTSFTSTIARYDAPRIVLCCCEKAWRTTRANATHPAIEAHLFATRSIRAASTCAC